MKFHITKFLTIFTNIVFFIKLKNVNGFIYIFETIAITSPLTINQITDRKKFTTNKACFRAPRMVSKAMAFLILYCERFGQE